MADSKQYEVLLEQRRTVTVRVAAYNQREAKARAKEHAGMGLPPQFLSEFKISVVGIREKKG